MALDRDLGLWDNFYDNFDEVMDACNIPEDKRVFLKDYRNGKQQTQISEDYDMDRADVRREIMIVFDRLRKHLGIGKSLG